METSPVGSLEEQIAELRSRVRQMEEALVSCGIPLQRAVAAQAAAAVPPLPASRPVAPPVQPPVNATTQGAPVRPLFAGSSAPPPQDTRSLENRIGSQWFNRIGILAMLIGMAWFLKFAIDNQWIGPLGRVAIGLVAGAGFIGWSERFRNRGYAVFSYSLKAMGSGTLYLSLWAAFSLYHLIPPPAAFAAMVLVTAFNGYMAWAQDAELLALYAIVGGLGTPLLVSTGGNHEVTLFTYLLLLDIAVLVLVVLRPWSRLLFGAFLGTVLLYIGWWLEYYSDSQSLRTAFFFGCFFPIFAFAPRLVRLDSKREGKLSAWDTLALVLLPIATAALGFLGFYALLNTDVNQWAGAWLAVGFAAFYLLLLRLPARGVLHASPGVLADLHLTAVVVFLTLAIPLKTQGRWLTVGWLAEGAALIWLSSRRQSRLLRVLALLCLALGLVALGAINPAASLTPFLNERFASYCFAIAVFAFTAWVALHRTGDRKDSWPVLGAGAVLAVNALILLAVGLEIDDYWWHFLRSLDSRSDYEVAILAQFTYSAWFMLFGAILLTVGFWRRSAFLRWQALALITVTIAKVFLFDMSELAQGFRILSFLGLGVLLMAVSFVYQRDWLKLRAANGGEDEA